MEEIISVGNKVDMEILHDGQLETDEEKRRILCCRVMDMPDYHIVRISMPFYEGRIVPLAVGDQYVMNFYAEKGIYGSRFVVINRLKEGNLFLADMEIQEPLHKIQRREFFRHNCRIPATYHMISPEELNDTSFDAESIEWKKSVLLDISGGGVRMVSEFQENTDLPMQLRFPIEVNGIQEEVTLFGKLVATYQNENNKILYEQRVEFENLDDKEREKIIHFIFEEERKKISKEKGF